MMRFVSPLRYPGGKGKLAPYICRLVRDNDLHEHCYVEPYAGGAAVAMTLLLTNTVHRVIINDLDEHVHAFWWAVLHDVERLCRSIHDTPVTLESWKRQKHIYGNCESYDLTDIGFSTFFLNRTNRSGILEGGVIGGMRQDGKYKIDARYNKENLIKRIQAIASRSNDISIFNEDALVLTKKLLKDRMPKFFYFDPPYFKKGNLLYKNAYTERDHWSMATVIKNLPFPCVITYDKGKEIEEIYSGMSMFEFDISYSAHLARPRGQEIMYYSNLFCECKPYARKET